MKVNETTAFVCSEPVINITGLDGRGLYYFENPKRANISFNVIAGEWKTKNVLKKLDRPLKYICPDLPAPVVKREIKPFRYRTGNNPNKCTIDFSNPHYADVFVDHEINENDIPFIVFVFFHENGHFFWGGADKESKQYEDYEHYCDCYAAKNMLERGFNPSQCLFAIELCLSEMNIARNRKDRLFEWLKKVTVK